MTDFGGARKWAQELVLKHLTSGGFAIDTTTGNGYDTLWLCQTVGHDGSVLGFDIQEEAVSRTHARLAEAGLEDIATLVNAGHERMDEYAKKQADAIVFNLGWLPGSPHECTTKLKTTLIAVDKALALLKIGGVLTVCVYPGHPEGEREKAALLNWAKELDDKKFDCVVFGYANIKKQPPFLIAVTKRKE